MKNETKKVYTTPRVTVHGDASQITLQTDTGGRYDREFGTPVAIGDPILKS